MDRRHFLTLQKTRSAKARPLFRTESGLAPYTGPWTENELRHLLKRVLFGVAPADLNYFKNKTVTQAVDELLSPAAPLPSPPLNDYTAADPLVAPGQSWVVSPTADGTLNSQRRTSFKKWWTGVLLNQDRSIREKLTLFWANHFSTEATDISNANYVYNHHALLRQNALGNFKQLVKAITVDAGMLRYLNGYLNTKTAPDENYGRELQELFTIGKNPVTNLSDFSEDDVKNAARVLTGWRINGNTFTVYFDPAKHDTGNKTFSAFYQHTTIAGQTGAAGANETDTLLTMLFQKAEVASFIVRKLYRWFVYYTIDAATEKNVIQPLAEIFRNGNYEIKPVLAALFTSEHFFDARNQGCLIKSPADVVIGCLREFGVSFPEVSTDFANAYVMWNYVYGWLSSMGQNPGDPPNVSGWPAYYQAPQFHELWINADTLPKRSRFTDTMITSGYTRNGKKLVIDAVAFAQKMPAPADPNQLLDDVLQVLYCVPLSSAAKQTIKQQTLLSNQVSDHYWTDAWNAYTASATPNNYTIVNNRLKALLQYLMNLAEYQLS